MPDTGTDSNFIMTDSAQTLTETLILNSDAILGNNNTGSTPGTIRFNGTNFQDYEGFSWINLDSQQIAQYISSINSNFSVSSGTSSLSSVPFNDIVPFDSSSINSGVFTVARLINARYYSTIPTKSYVAKYDFADITNWAASIPLEGSVANLLTVQLSVFFKAVTAAAIVSLYSTSYNYYNLQCCVMFTSNSTTLSIQFCWCFTFMIKFRGRL